jgi:hypothetical protein
MSDIRTVHLTEIYESLYTFGRNRHRELQQVETELDDFVQSVILNIFNRKGLDIPDGGKEYPNLHYLIECVANRHLLDLKRTKFGTRKRQYVSGEYFKFVSTSTPILEEGEAVCLEDILQADSDINLIFFEFLERCPDEKISKKILISWKELLERSMNESAKEIADSIGIGVNRVKTYQKKLAGMLNA